MNRKKRSVIWKIQKEELEELVSKNDTFTSILLHFGLACRGGNTNTLKKRLDNDNISYSHISLGRGANKNRFFRRKEKIPLEKILVENSSYSRSNLKKRLIQNNLISYQCDICESGPEWRGEKLVLIIDHINGVYNDNRIENLRFVCPNCNSQLDTFSGKNMKSNLSFHERNMTASCIECKNPCGALSIRCIKCSNKKSYKKPKIQWPTNDELLELLKSDNYSSLGRKLGVSDNAIRKRLKRENTS